MTPNRCAGMVNLEQFMKKSALLLSTSRRSVSRRSRPALATLLLPKSREGQSLSTPAFVLTASFALPSHERRPKVPVGPRPGTLPRGLVRPLYAYELFLRFFLSSSQRPFLVQVFRLQVAYAFGHPRMWVARRIVGPTASMGIQFAYGQGGTNSASHHLGRDSGPRCSCLLEVSGACPSGLAKNLRTQADRFLAARVSMAYSASSSC